MKHFFARVLLVAGCSLAWLPNSLAQQNRGQDPNQPGFRPTSSQVSLSAQSGSILPQPANLPAPSLQTGAQRPQGTGVQQVLEDFELRSTWPWAPWIQVGDLSMNIGSNGVISSAAAHSGLQGLSLPTPPVFNAGWYRRSDVNLGLAGDRVSQWVRLTGTDSRAYLGFSATPAGAYALAVAPNTGQLIFQRNPGYDFIDVVAVPFTWQLNKWYRLEVTWLTGTQVEGQVYDSDGSTLLAALRMTAPLTPGGVAIRGFGGSQLDDLLSNGYAPSTITTGPVRSLLCAGNFLDVPFTVVGNFSTGNIFTAQLSDAAGNFASPVTIGSLIGTNSANITAALPIGTPAGNGYRIRVVSSAPVVTGSSSPITITPPVRLTSPANQTVAADPGQCTALVTFAATVTGTAPSFLYTIGTRQITSPFSFPIGTTTVNVSVTGNCGTFVNSFTVTVLDRQAPTIRAAGFVTALESNGTRTIEAADVDWGSTDACSGIASMTISPRTFTCANVGPNAVTLTVTDGAGNSASETVTVLIVDNTAPTLRVAGFQTQLQNGTRTIFPADIDYGSFDNCGSIVSTSISPRTFTCANIGPNPVTFTATDNSGNTTTQTVTVVITADATCTAAVAANPATSPTGILGKTNQLEAYPNPAKEQATLRFKAMQTGPAQVQVYNSLGRLVATLYNGVAEQGQVYERTFTSTSLPAGLYTCRFIQQDKSVTQRLVISK